MTTPIRSACVSALSVSGTGSRVAVWSVGAALAAQFGSQVHAQSTGSAAIEGETVTEVVVSAQRIVTLGTVTQQNATKTRIAVTQEYLNKQVAGQSIFNSLNQVPGVNFTNNDAYGNSGGNLRIRGFEGSRIAATFDGMPLNDSGNYALFTNQILDSELVERIDVNLGATDVDSPTASATGGTVNFKSITPTADMGGKTVLSIGEDNYRRLFALFNTGEIGPWGTKAWIAASTTEYDKFKGTGDMEKQQYNAKVLQEFGDEGDFASLAFHWNRNRVAFYRTAAAATFKQFGFDYDNISSCTLDSPTANVRDNDGNQPVANIPGGVLAVDNPANPSSCANYWGVRFNPSDTGNIRGQSLFHLGENFRLTIDPSFQYVLANGGGSTVQEESVPVTTGDRRIVGSTGLAGFDINGDGDILDAVRLYTPSNTNTKRYGLTTSLIYDIDPTNRVRVAYSLDYAKHKQTAAWGYLTTKGDPENVFAGRQGKKVPTADGSYLRGRDRFSIAELNQFSAEYRGEFLDSKLVTQIGLRAPYFTRELNQYCYTPDGQSGGTGGGSLCTTQVPVRTLPNGNVQFGTATTQYISPYKATIKFDDILPNVGATYKLTENQTVYVSYAENLSAPRTDNLYPVRRQADNSIGRGIPNSETTTSYDIGWRFNSADFIASAAAYYIDYDNRIVSSFDPDLGFSVDRNVGKVKIQGFDVQAGFRVIDMLTLSGSASYNDSELQDNVPLTATTFSPTKGKRLVETPEWTFSSRADLTFGEHISAGLEGKYVDERPSTDTNDEFAPSYVVWNADASYKFSMGAFKNLEAQVNVVNVFDKDYFGSISSGLGGTSVGFFSIGAPRTFVLALVAEF